MPPPANLLKNKDAFSGIPLARNVAKMAKYRGLRQQGLKQAVGKAAELLRGSGGFTLIEMLVATTVLALGLLGVIGMQLYSINGNAYSWNLSLAQNIAQQKIEYFKNESYNAAKTDHFGTVYTSYAAVPSTVISPSDEIPAGGDHSCEPPAYANACTGYDGTTYSDAYNAYQIDSEWYGGLKRDIDNDPYMADSFGNLVTPYTNFRRVTIKKIIDGNENWGDPDCSMVIKVLVYWKDQSGTEHKVAMMTEKALGD